MILKPIKAGVKEIWLNGRLVPTHPLTPWDVTHLVKCGVNELRLVYYGDYSWSDIYITPLLPVDFNFFASSYVTKVADICWSKLQPSDWLNWPEGDPRSVLRHDDVSFGLHSIAPQNFECKPPLVDLPESLPAIGITPQNPLSNQAFQVEFSKPLEATTYTATLYLDNPAQFASGTRLKRVLGTGVALDRTVLVFALPPDSNLEWMVEVDFDSGRSVRATVLNYGRFFADSNFSSISGSVGAGVSCRGNCPPPDSSGDCIGTFKLGGVAQFYDDCEKCGTIITSDTHTVFDLSWATDSFENTGFEGSLEPTVRNPWVITDSGRKVRFVVEDSLNCGGPNDNIQSGTATATIQVGDFDVIMSIDFEGVVEYQDTGFERISFILDGGAFSNVLLAEATSADLDQECVSGSLRPQEKIFHVSSPYTLLAGVTYTLRITFTTYDNLFHVGCYYQVNFGFVEMGTGGGEATTSYLDPLPPPSIPAVAFSTPQAGGSSDALVLYVAEYSTGDDTPSGEYVAELDSGGNRTGTWAKVGSDRFGIIASGNLSEIVDYTLDSEVLYTLSNPANPSPYAANLGVYTKVNGNAKRAIVTHVRP